MRGGAEIYELRAARPVIVESPRVGRHDFAPRDGSRDWHARAFARTGRQRSRAQLLPLTVLGTGPPPAPPRRCPCRPHPATSVLGFFGGAILGIGGGAGLSSAGLELRLAISAPTHTAPQCCQGGLNGLHIGRE